MADRPSDGASRDTALRVEQAFASVADGHDSTHEQLQKAVCAFVDARKGSGSGPEQLIVQLKQMANATRLATGRYFRPTPKEPGVDADVVALAVRWCIEHYYREEPRVR
jgi:hypothetical protein